MPAAGEQLGLQHQADDPVFRVGVLVMAPATASNAAPALPNLSWEQR